MNKNGEKVIGYTTGVYDLFHIGHLNILRRAREQCDYLIVGVSTDKLVKEYKNKKPIIPFSERMQIVGAIKYVDKVVPQETLDKIEAWEKYKFDVMFHGSDWKGSQLYKDIVKKLDKVGVQSVYLPYTTGTSSTMLAEKLQNM